ncbi:hypothetical protein Q5P01_011729 [Channa striata]|uniref:Cathepsin K n=1 Tax=Channa striata TaxID=64152 RepID=A0AA88MTV8_CHASR|nr:hypothetical protein Q5P01_011729 [Channa striata]
MSHGKSFLGRMFLCAVLLPLPAVLYVDWVPHGSTLDAQWEQWKIKHEKNYNGDEDYRRTVWEQNLHMITTHNQEAERGKYSYKLGMNYLADMTPGEVAEKRMCLVNHHRGNFSGFRTQTKTKCYQQAPEDIHDWSTNTVIWKKGTYKTTTPKNELPKSIDYRQKGLVTSVKVQGFCGACWAFSAAAALEGQLAKKTGHLVDLSTQNLLDCVTNMGCKGGHMMNAFMYVQENGGMNSEADYPYVEEEQSCRFKPSAIAAQCSGFQQIPEGDEHELALALLQVGPISVVIDSSLIFRYRSGQ